MDFGRSFFDFFLEWWEFPKKIGAKKVGQNMDIGFFRGERR